MMSLNALQKCMPAAHTEAFFHESAFLLGTMGPDPYFGDALPPPVGSRARTDLADRLHAEDGGRLFSCLFALSRGDDALFSYALGFLCHFLLDNRTHPYISTRYPGKLHTPAEIAIDAELCANAIDARFLSSPTAVYLTNDLAALDALHAQLFWKLFALRTEGLYSRSLKKWLRINDLSFDPRGKKRALLRPFPAATQFLLTPGQPSIGDSLNLSHAPWGVPDAAGKPRTESFQELLEAATNEAAALIGLACALRESGDSAPLCRRLEGRSADASEWLCR